MVKVLVIGGAGYIGSHVALELIDKSYDVTVYDNLSTGQKANLTQEAKFIQGDILDFQSLKNAMKGVDAVIHLAGKKAVGESMQNPQLYAVNNMQGSINILNAMAEKNIKNIVFSSSAAVYGIPQYLPIDEQHPKNPMNFYGYTKCMMEDLMAWYEKLKGIRYMALRYFNAVGYDALKRVKGKEANPQNLLPIIMDAATSRRDGFQIFGNDYDTKDGTCERDYIHVSDLATAHEKAIHKLLSGEQSRCLNLGTGKAVSVQQVVDAAEQVIGKSLKYSYAPRRAGDPAVLVAKADLARQVLGWTPRYTDIKEIIQTTWNMEI